MKLNGIFVALVTPFQNGALNETKVRQLVQRQLTAGTDGFVPCGTTGESPSLTETEKTRLFEIVVEEAKGKATIVAGTGTNNTQKTIDTTRRAKEIGVDVALVITPYYNKPSQEGLFRHFEAVCTSVDLPIMIYNVPGRTGVNLLPATLERLSQIDTIVAIKEASGDLCQITQMARQCGDRIKILSGDDNLFAPTLAVGGVGIVSVLANIIPADLKALYDAYSTGQTEVTLAWHHKLFPLCQAMFYESNPAPVKTALNLMGVDVGDLRLPLAPMSDENVSKLKLTLSNYGLLH